MICKIGLTYEDVDDSEVNTGSICLPLFIACSLYALYVTLPLYQYVVLDDSDTSMN